MDDITLGNTAISRTFPRKTRSYSMTTSTSAGLSASFLTPSTSTSNPTGSPLPALVAFTNTPFPVLLQLSFPPSDASPKHHTFDASGQLRGDKYSVLIQLEGVESKERLHLFGTEVVADEGETREGVTVALPSWTVKQLAKNKSDLVDSVQAVVVAQLENKDRMFAFWRARQLEVRSEPVVLRLRRTVEEAEGVFVPDDVIDSKKRTERGYQTVLVVDGDSGSQSMWQTLAPSGALVNEYVAE